MRLGEHKLRASYPLDRRISINRIGLPAPPATWLRGDVLYKTGEEEGRTAQDGPGRGRSIVAIYIYISTLRVLHIRASYLQKAPPL